MSDVFAVSPADLVMAMRNFGSPISARELAADVELTPAECAETLQLMEKRGLVEMDVRGYWVLTTDGQTIKPETLPPVDIKKPAPAAADENQDEPPPPPARRGPKPGYKRKGADLVMASTETEVRQTTNAAPIAQAPPAAQAAELPRGVRIVETGLNFVIEEGVPRAMTKGAWPYERLQVDQTIRLPDYATYERARDAAAWFKRKTPGWDYEANKVELRIRRLA